MAFARARGQDRCTTHRPLVYPLPVPRPACAVINRSEAGIAGTIASASAAGSCSTPSPQTNTAIGLRPAGVWPRTTRPPWNERRRSQPWRTCTSADGPHRAAVRWGPTSCLESPHTAHHIMMLFPSVQSAANGIDAYSRVHSAQASRKP
jgi:hypothetical protein